MKHFLLIALFIVASLAGHSQRDTVQFQWNGASNPTEDSGTLLTDSAARMPAAQPSTFERIDSDPAPDILDGTNTLRSASAPPAMVPSIKHSVRPVPGSNLTQFLVEATVANPLQLRRLRVKFKLPPTATASNHIATNCSVIQQQRELTYKFDRNGGIPAAIPIAFTLDYDWTDAQESGAGVAAWLEYSSTVSRPIQRTEVFQVPIYQPKGVVLHWRASDPPGN